ncbi:MAG TPA: glycolate oxidase subunit GlcF [Burkholderiales bacterium]|nr:glycolate oxidase subunit GlcF [Burkholderiales bacterium]
MQTSLADFIRDTPEGREADAILRNCVHCGFCTATCPTYQLLGDELDSPRGRIYLIKQTLEGKPVTGKTQLHLDRCLTCRACESTCPSGVHYSRLLDIGREVVAARVKRSPAAALQRLALRKVIPHPALFGALLRMGQLARPVLPRSLKNKVPARVAPPGPVPRAAHARQMLVLAGCAQPALAPATNAAAARVLDRLGIALNAAPEAGCCGAVSFHLDAQDEARDYMRRNIDAWWPHIEGGAEAIVITATGCGVMVKDYGYQLAHDRAYASKAQRVAALAKDIGEVLLGEAEKLRLLVSGTPPAHRRIAFHAPCTLQHGLRMRGEIEALLVSVGYEVLPVRDAHLCCGSAGTYSLLQPELARRLRDDKIEALTAHAPDEIVTANIGCQAHLQSATEHRIRHWIELIDDRLSSS